MVVSRVTRFSFTCLLHYQTLYLYWSPPGSQSHNLKKTNHWQNLNQKKKLLCKYGFPGTVVLEKDYFNTHPPLKTIPFYHSLPLEVDMVLYLKTKTKQQQKTPQFLRKVKNVKIYKWQLHVMKSTRGKIKHLWFNKCLPTTSSFTSFQIRSISGLCSCIIVMASLLWMPWWSINRPAHGWSSLWSTTQGTYLYYIKCHIKLQTEYFMDIHISLSLCIYSPNNIDWANAFASDIFTNCNESHFSWIHCSVGNTCIR